MGDIAAINVSAKTAVIKARQLGGMISRNPRRLSKRARRRLFANARKINVLRTTVIAKVMAGFVVFLVRARAVITRSLDPKIKVVLLTEISLTR